MPYLSFIEIRTPLILFSIRFYRETESRDIYIKLGNRRRRPFIRKKTTITPE